MKIEVIEIDSLKPELKLFIHRTGKIGFTKSVERYMGIAHGKSITFGLNSENKNDKDFYVVVHDKKVKNGFKVQKNGEYLSIHTKILLDNYGFDYSKGTLCIDIEEIKQAAGSVFKFIIKEK